MPAFLFVYGTLMSWADSDYGRESRARLHAAATPLGPATVRGRLHDLGAYPGFVTSTDADDVVHGELLRLDEPGAVFPWLDAYEGIVAGARDNEYERVTIEARLAGGGTVTAWAYLCRLDVSALPRIAGGRWNCSPT